MPRGLCKLCLQNKNLCNSHYLPKSLYRRMRKEGGGHPIVMTPGLIVSTSRQVRDHVFCADCEDRFNSGGEAYFMSLVANGQQFPMDEKLKQVQPLSTGQFLMFSGARAGIDPLRVGHFALGLLWKGAVHSWHTFGTQVTKVRPLPDMESVRRYLLGEIEIPANILVFVLVCRDPLSQVSNSAPYLLGGFENENRYEMHIKGVKIQIAFDPPASEIDALCFVHSKLHPIFAANCHSATLEAARHLHRTAHLAKNLPLTEKN